MRWRSRAAAIVAVLTLGAGCGGDGLREGGDECATCESAHDDSGSGDPFWDPDVGDFDPGGGPAQDPGDGGWDSGDDGFDGWEDPADDYSGNEF